MTPSRAPNPDGREFENLSFVHEQYEKRGDPRFGTVRPLEHIESLHAVIVEAVDQPTLRMLHARATSWALRKPPEDLLEAQRNAGAWLRVFHELPGRAEFPERRTTAQDYHGALCSYRGYLEPEFPDPGLFESAFSSAEARLDVISDALSIRPSHGDYAARNIFVGHGAAVTVFDILGQWRQPTLEDVAYFMTGLRVARSQVLTQGRAYAPRDIDRFEEEFLRGYYGGEPVPRDAITLFQLLILFDKWASVLASARLSQSLAKPARSVINRYFGKETQRLLSSLR